MGWMRSALLWASENKSLENHFRKRRFARTAVARFMPGETLDDALLECVRLGESGRSTVITLLGEMVSDQAAVDRVVDHYVTAFRRIRADGLDTHVSVKLTHLGLDLGGDVALAAVRRLLSEAEAMGSFLWVDMEYSRYVERTVDVFRTARGTGAPLGLCLQAYLHRTPSDLKELVRDGAAIRLVKGAYLEPPEVALPRKEDVDRRFLDQAVQLARAWSGVGQRPGIATHDLTLIDHLQRALADHDGPVPYEVQMLYGIQRAAQARMAAAGTPVRVLISYGDAWFPWYVRRLAERPANLAFVLRSMVRP